MAYNQIPRADSVNITMKLAVSGAIIYRIEDNLNQVGPAFSESFSQLKVVHPRT